MFKKASLTAQDHIEEIRQDINTWQQAENKNNLIPAISPSSPTKVTPLPKALSLVVRDYQRWIKNYDTLTPKVIKRMQQRLQEWEYQPLISIVMPTYNTDEKWLRIAIDSVQQQIYPHWELCIADDASTQPHVRQILAEYAQHDDRIKLLFRTENGHISAASNTALAMVSGELVAFLDHDDKLVRSALFWIAKAVLEHPDAMLWYSDEDKINEDNQRFQPYFKSDWNPDLFLSHNLITHLAVYRTALIQQIGGFREGYEGAQDYDLALRAIEHLTPAQICHIPRVLYHWRMIDGSTAKDADEKPYAIIAAQKAIREHLARRNIEAQVMEAPDLPGTIRVQYALPSHLPLVSLIIPTRNNLELLHRCVESILNKTDYDPIEILIINNNSDDPATLTYLQQLEDNDQARIIDYSHPFNYADMNNRAVEYAQGEIIGLINNDIEVINPEWLSEMVSHLLRPEVGIVGARLWYPNDTLQHAGVILGIGGVAGHPHKGLPRNNPGYFNRANLIQSLSAVTGACLIMQKSNFLAVGGLDAEHLAIAFNDIDLCLKMSERQLRVVWTPYAELYHHESASRGYEDTPEKIARFEKECLYMKKRWGNLLLTDPAYNPNLTLETQDFALAWPPRVAILP
ncbi:MAG: glycosyltransferase family 2 protein [Thioploca sp.]|nr:glycosyltransferase family 2 protein [Thioploca sp.]